MGHLSLLRFRHGYERQVSDATRAAVAEAWSRGVEKPWMEHGAAGAMCMVAHDADAGGSGACGSEPAAGCSCEGEGVGRDRDGAEAGAASAELAFVDDEVDDLSTEAASSGGAETAATGSGEEAAAAGDGPLDARWRRRPRSSQRERRGQAR